jgi:hypothetical protein
VPNFWNVVSNLPFIAVGAAGLRRFYRNPATLVLFLGVLLTGFGSTYYHWNPNDGALFWDRLPMTLCFMAILAIFVEERVNARFGAALLWPLLATGILSLLLWRWTGDLRLYGWVQFFPAIALPLLLVLFPHAGTFYWLIAGLLYAIAKLFELADHAVYSSFILSGHTLKHLFGAAACFAILRYFQKRQLVAALRGLGESSDRRSPNTLTCCEQLPAADSSSDRYTHESHGAAPFDAQYDRALRLRAGFVDHLTNVG